MIQTMATEKPRKHRESLPILLSPSVAKMRVASEDARPSEQRMMGAMRESASPERYDHTSSQLCDDAEDKIREAGGLTEQSDRTPRRSDYRASDALASGLMNDKSRKKPVTHGHTADSTTTC